jgi:Cof subfamily protein (haloacid dehalogenase superfamily)
MFLDHKKNIQMVLVDLDGTLLNNNKKIGTDDLLTLQLLGNMGIIRVFATGRNLHSAKSVLPDNCPFDYLIFSSGAGIMDWNTKELLFQSVLSKIEVLNIENVLKVLGLNFSIHFPIPENHRYYFFKGKSYVPDFECRNNLYRDFNAELNDFYPLENASQFLIILNHENEIEAITDSINGFKVIRATSPIDGISVWIEIFSNNVSKATGGKFLCEMLDISQDATLGIGNDYNDLELLDWTAQSFIVSNAPDVIKSKYTQCADNQNNPLSDVLNKILY